MNLLANNFGDVLKVVSQAIGGLCCVIVAIFLVVIWIAGRRYERDAPRRSAAKLARELERARQLARQKPTIVPPPNWLDGGLPTGAPATPANPAAPTPPPGAATSSAPVANLPDVATFAPMSDDQVAAAAKGINVWASLSFGRRDLIPPVSDRRTLLIDKGMVGHGFITPEQLADIHRIGAEMDRVRPDVQDAVAGAFDQADRAVRQTIEDRKQLKERKRAEVAERKRLRGQAVAHRRATDIVFLGRGVSKGLAGRDSDPAKLAAANLPLMSTPADVAKALELTIPRLRWLAFHAEAATRTHYVRFTIPKRSGGTRQLFAPHRSLAAAQEWILHNVLAKVPVHAAAHGFVAGRSTVTNAAPHVDRDVVVNADLRDFFPTVTFPRVRGIFEQLGYSPAVATILALLCTESPRRVVVYAGQTFHVATAPRALPQGACTSPALSNLAARRMDSRLTGIAAKLNYRFTRYADDMTFSCVASSEAESPTTKVGYLLARLRHIAADEGFAVNEDKTRVLRRAARQEVTGVVVNVRPGVPRELHKRLRAILHRAKHEGLARQNRDGRPNFEAWLTGMIAYISMVNEKQGRALADALAEVR